MPTKDTSTQPPAPEVLRPQTDTSSPVPDKSPALTGKPSVKPTGSIRRRTYRPSHKATFVGIGVVVAILAINVAIITFIMNSQQAANSSVAEGEVTLSSTDLDKLGVSRNPIGSAGTELVVSPNSRFNAKVTVGGDVSIAGQLKLNSKFTASDASLEKLQAGTTSLEDLNVNGDGTISTLNLRKDLAVVGTSRLQGAVTISQLLTVNNNTNIAGSLAVGGTLSVRTFQASSLTSDTTLTIGGHIITRGSAPGVGPGPAVGSNGTVSISGNDAAGTVAVNMGTGAGNGILAQVAFRSQYATTPHVIVTTVGAGVGSIYISRTIGGFSIGVNGSVAPGGYAFDYIVMQ
jgi:hypothetical protein